ncbi:CLUMA_CG005567, isoform A [Clunio marinus]|uniref:Methionyl-tRNA formyltransferase, mitochondrial n=1 Tax=Clunio marinus TaxID=568069 RepID=A0A1J1HVG2_9DIPT|nr:CLUMA_CG005567, isoform A [Clunio marinus]
MIIKTLNIIIKVSCKGLQWQRSYSSLKVLYFGTDKFSLPSLKRLSEQNLARLEVVTSYKARNNPIKSYADKNCMKVYDWTSFLKEESDICKDFDLGIVVSFGHLIPENIIESFKHGMLNVHASILPKYRGASPIIYAIRNGDKETGVSIMKIKPHKFDVGEILMTQRTDIPDDMLMHELHDKLSNLGAELLLNCIENLSTLKETDQNDHNASYAPKINKEFCKVRWNVMMSDDIFNLYRSIYSFKNILTTFKNEPVKLIEIAKCDKNNPPVLEEQGTSTELSPGHLIFCKKSKKLFVKCLDENFLEIKKISLGKKKVMSAVEFRNGFMKNYLNSNHYFE